MLVSLFAGGDLKLKTIIIATISLFLLACAEENMNTNNKEQYIVVLKENVSIASASNKIRAQAVSASLQQISTKHSISETAKFSKLLQAGVYTLSKKDLERLQQDPMVAYIEKDYIMTTTGVQNNPTWGLDRIDQTATAGDSQYRYDLNGSNVNAYVIDTGININHTDFDGRAKHGYDFVGNDNIASDCNGHGTHVAGTIAGTKYGVAKQAKVYALKVLGCNGSGSNSDVIKAVEWVSENHIKPAVANMSLGGPASRALDTAVAKAIDKGVTFVVAAGNSNEDACSSSPARVNGAITVGSTDKNDRRSSFSNYGTCLDIYAPGSNILSAWYNSNSASKSISGTSMAAPHVAGVVALHLEKFPASSPEEVNTALVVAALSEQVKDAKSSSPNKLLNVEYLNLEPEYLLSGDVITQISGSNKSENHYAVEVPAGANLMVAIQSGNGDADLYIRKGARPSSTNYDCRPYLWGNNETCSLNDSNKQIYYIMIKGYSNYSDIELRVSY